jgi:ABC-2 type transport system permease protein
LLNNLRGVYTVWYRDLLRFYHDKMRMLSSITLPLLFLFVFGSGLRSSIGGLGGDIDYAQFMFPGIIGMTVLMSSFMGGIGIVWDREFGFLKEVLVAPVSRASVALGKTMGTATVALLQGIIILLISPIVGISLDFLTILQMIPLMLLVAVSLGSLGVLIATRIKSMEAFQGVMQLLMFPMIFLSGVFFPLQGLPGWMSVLVKLNPATYGVYPLRLVMLGPEAQESFGIVLFGHQVTLWEDIFLLALFSVIMITLGMWSFGHQD